MNAAAEVLERQLQTIRALKLGIDTFNNSPSARTLAPSGARDEAYQWANSASLLGVAQPMYWTRETAEAVVAMAPTFELQSILCDRELLYCDVAFCWFEHPVLSIALRGGGVVPVHALTWAFAARHGTHQPMITLTAYMLKNGTPTPVTWSSVDYQQPMDNVGEPDADALTDQEFVTWKRQCGDLFRFVVCAGAFLRQKIAIVEEQRADRHARKRLVAAGWTQEPVVSVVMLRERERRQVDERVNGDREYQWQWMVRAHTRQQYYPSLEKHLPIIIGPYIKGPEDKPLKPRTTPILFIGR